jgi:hypothetical protein
MVEKYDSDKSLVRIGNRLTVGDGVELIIPGEIKPVEFTIEKMWDSETGEEVDHVNPGKVGQNVLMNIPVEAKEGWFIRRKRK